MRLYRPPVIGPRAAGVSLVVIGITVFVLLGLFSPVPAGAQGNATTSSPGYEPVRCDEFTSQAAAQAYFTALGPDFASVLDPDGNGIACESVPGTQWTDAGAMVVQRTGEWPQGRMFLTFAIVTLAAAILIESRLKPGRQGLHPVSSRRQRM